MKKPNRLSYTFEIPQDAVAYSEATPERISFFEGLDRNIGLILHDIARAFFISDAIDNYKPLLGSIAQAALLGTDEQQRLAGNGKRYKHGETDHGDPLYTILDSYPSNPCSHHVIDLIVVDKELLFGHTHHLRSNRGVNGEYRLNAANRTTNPEPIRRRDARAISYIGSNLLRASLHQTA